MFVYIYIYIYNGCMTINKEYLRSPFFLSGGDVADARDFNEIVLIIKKKTKTKGEKPVGMVIEWKRRL